MNPLISKSTWTIDPQRCSIRHASLPLELSGLKMYITLNRTRRHEKIALNSLKRSSFPSGIEYSADSGTLNVHMLLNVNDQVTLRSRMINPGDEDLYVEKLELVIPSFLIGSHDHALSVFKNGHQSWSETHSFTERDWETVPILAGMEKLQGNPRNSPTRLIGDINSEMFTLVGKPREHVFLVAGQIQPYRQFLYFNTSCRTFSNRARLHIVFDLGGRRLASREELDLDPIWMQAGQDPNELVDAYLSVAAPQRDETKPAPNGWCSWYYHFAKVAETDIHSNLDAYQHQENPGWDLFVVDDGYEKVVGDWQPNGKFPNGLGSIAEKITQAGMSPGIWIAPFIARKGSVLTEKCPEWFLKDKKGRLLNAGWNPNWGLDGFYYSLDTTHPGFQQYLHNWIERLVKKEGFRFLKLDFTYAASLYGQAYDSDYSSAERLTLGYRLIREAAGQDVFLLACGSPLSPAIGQVDGMRVGPDVAPYWFSPLRYYLTRDPHPLCVKFAIRSILNRGPFHRRFWINDPDCMLLRETENGLNDEERFSLINAVVVSGGMGLFSDHLATYKERQWQLASSILGLLRRTEPGRMIPIDFMEKPIPELVFNSSGFLAVFNFANRTVFKKLVLPDSLKELLSGASLTEVWKQKKIEIHGNVLDLGPMKPHASLLFEVSR